MGLAGALGDTVGSIPMLTFDSMTYVVAGGMLLIVLGRPRATAVNQAGLRNPPAVE